MKSKEKKKYKMKQKKKKKAKKKAKEAIDNGSTIQEGRVRIGASSNLFLTRWHWGAVQSLPH